jgi:hypothetical protein
MMSNDSINWAISRMIIRCDAHMPNYDAVSARSILGELDYQPEEIDEILLVIAGRGFDYCLDHTIVMTGHHEARGEKPNREVCYWGPDQLKSRLQCLRSS